MKRKIFSKLLMGAFLIASVSMFVSCKDYDDDIQKNAADIAALKAQLGTDISAAKSDLTAQLSAAKAELQTAINNAVAAKANQSDLDKTNAELAALKEDVKALEAKIATLETQLAALEAIQADLAKVSEALGAKADAAKVEELEGKLAAITGDLQNFVTEEKATAIAAAAVATLDNQLKAFEAYEARIKALEGKVLDNSEVEALAKEVADLKEKLSKIDIDEAVAKLDAKVNEAIEDLKSQFQPMSEAITKVNADLDAFKVFVLKKLTSIVLKPDFYWEGIEGVEVAYARPAVFVPVDNSKAEYTYYVIQNVNGQWVPVKGDQNIKVVVDTKMQYKRDAQKNIIFTELSAGGKVSYHLNPSNADIEGSKISFFENLAEVYTRGAYIDAKPINETLKADMVKNGIIEVPFTANYDQIWNYFSKWAFDNNTYVPATTTISGNTKTASTYTKTVDGKTHVYQIGYDDNGNAYYVYNYEPLWNDDQNQWNAYGTSDYWDAKGNYLGQDVAPLPFIAAQISKNDTVVTSDYGVVVPAVYEILALGDKKPDTVLDQGSFVNNHTDKPYRPDGYVTDNHLYVNSIVDGAFDQEYMSSYYSAIPMPATHQVVYTDKINLKPFIETHYNYISYVRYGQSFYDKVMDDATMEALGLEYHFTPVDYKIGKNSTGETKHIERVDADGNVSTDVTSGWFAPRSVTADGQTISGKTATQEAVDREPLIRVDLVKKSTQEIVMYGYIKLRIVKDKVDDLDVPINLSEMYMNCGEEKAITWSQVENLILAKLGIDGMTKQDFEKNYYLEVEGNYEEMPTNLNGGTLYNAPWRAKRYTIAKVDENGKWVVANAETDFNKYTASNNRFGRVWYTPNDNATNTHHWDEQTNVLMWNFKNDDTVQGWTDGSTSFKQAYTKMISVLGATYENKGESQNELSTVVRFTNKNNGTHVNVKLYIDAKKVFFAYGDINRRVLDHWYDYRQGYRDMTADTIEVYANVPTPAEVARPALGTFSDAKGVTPFGFKKDLTEYWLEQKVIVDMYNIGKFSNFKNNNVTFKFRLPKKDTNTLDLDLDADATKALKVDVWQAMGASGRLWYVGLNAAKDQILAYGYNDGKGIVDYRTVAGGPGQAVPVCTLTPQGQIHWLGRIEETGAPYLMDNKAALAQNNENVNEPANDILNYIGMYDQNGNKQKNVYLTGQKNKTFAAYVEIVVANDACYDPLIGKNYFNVRFLRPINVWPAKTFWKDAPNKTQIYEIWKLINMRDWRTYAIVMDNEKQNLDDGNVTYEGKYVDGEKASVPYSFYNIKNLYVERAEIRSDAYLPASERVANISVAAIKNLKTIDAIPALTGKNTDGSTRWEYFKIVDTNMSATTAGKTALGQVESTLSTDKLAYTNNGGVVKEFHVFVPISVVYSHGALKPWTQTVWAVITIDPTVGNE